MGLYVQEGGECCVCVRAQVESDGGVLELSAAHACSHKGGRMREGVPKGLKPSGTRLIQQAGVGAGCALHSSQWVGRCYACKH